MSILFGNIFLKDVQNTLRKYLSLDYFSLPGEGTGDLPVVEVGYPECALEPPTHMTGDSGERAFIEPSVNAIRISILFACPNQSCEKKLLIPLLRAIHSKGEHHLTIIRRKPLLGYDISFLFTYRHLLLRTPLQLVKQMGSILTEIQKQLQCLLDCPSTYQCNTVNKLLTALVEIHSFPAKKLGSNISEPDPLKDKNRK